MLCEVCRERDASVNELREATGASQQTVSKHLGVLLEAGIVGRRKEGNQVFYSIVDEGIFRLCEEVCGGLQRQVAELNAIVAGVGR